jgi:hypothetical protein
MTAILGNQQTTTLVIVVFIQKINLLTKAKSNLLYPTPLLQIGQKRCYTAARSRIFGSSKPRRHPTGDIMQYRVKGLPLVHYHNAKIVFFYRITKWQKF